MESKKAKSKFIKNWIEQDDQPSGAAPLWQSSGSGGPHSVAHPFRYVEKSDSIAMLAEQFLNALKSGYNESYDGMEWTVEVVIPDRDSTIYIICVNNQMTMNLENVAEHCQAHMDARLSMPFEDLRLLTNYETDYVAMIMRNERVDVPETPLIRPLSDLLFGAYNLHYLDPIFNNTLIEHLYQTGKVSNLAGVERFLYPWAISADIGNVLYKLIVEHDLKRSLEIGLAYGLSGLFMTQAHKNRNYGQHTSVDPCQSVEFQSIGIDQMTKAGFTEHFRLLEAKDYDILPVLVKEQEKFDFIFIDGLHMHDYVVIDYFYSDLILEIGGIMAFDDCHAPGVSSAVAYMEENRNYKFLAHQSDHRLRVYQKLSEDNRTINDPNRHIEYFDKYFELSVVDEEIGVQSGRPVARKVQENIAIIGVDGLMPQDQNIEQYWQSIINENILYDRYSHNYLYDRSAAGSNAQSDSMICAMITSPFAFDADFFNISEKEAELMDPQLRRLLMSVHTAIEDAGYTPAQLVEKTVGVFIGSEGSGYNELHRSQALASGYLLNHTGSSMANRVSHHFDFTGPSEVIDTMCSSGAYGLHRAVDLLRKGEIDYAIVGAVKMNFLDNVFQSLNDLNITSTGDRCYSFHQQSKGYIRAEGIITVVLTRAEMAAREKDHVYANIKATAVNFNGKDGNSMFSPSKNGQKRVMKMCYENAGVSMSDLDFIEAQGMGNEISDFVEFNAINEACEELLLEGKVEVAQAGAKGPLISTVKPIIGHMECVSALGALLKVILSFKNRTVYKIPNLSDEQVSAKLDVANSRCALATANHSIDDNQTMLAGLNSFGASGSNVHILLESPEPLKSTASAAPEYQLLPVSAKSAGALAHYLSLIGEYLATAKGPRVLADLSQTFQLRRSHYSERVMFCLEAAPEAEQISRLQQLLKQYAAKSVAATDIVDNQVGSLYHHTKIGQEASTHQPIYLDGLSWLGGAVVDFKRHHRSINAKVGRMPTYPFELHEHKLSLAEGANSSTVVVQSASAAQSSWLHPLLQQNTSNLAEQSYSANFDGSEFFLRDHQVNGQKIFPAVAYLEMANAAMIQAVPAAQSGSCLSLSNVVWMQPAVVDGPKRLSIALYSALDEQWQQQPVDFEVYSGECDADERLHCQGQAVYAQEQRPAPLNIEQLRTQMNQGVVQPSDFYGAFARMGIEYGPAHQGIHSVVKGNDQLLAEVHLPAVVIDTLSDYVLHPSVLDSALQTSLGLMADLTGLSGSPALPFAVDKVTVFGPCSDKMHVWMRYSPGSSGNDNVVKFDVDLTDERGNVCVQIRGFSSRSVERDLSRFDADLNAADASTGARASTSRSASASASAGPTASLSVEVETDYRRLCVDYFRQLVAETLKTSESKIQPGRSFAEFGLDSILVVQLTNRLRRIFSGITSTLFFEVQTLDGLVDYFIHHKKDELDAILVNISGASPPVAEAVKPLKAAPEKRRQSLRHNNRRQLRPSPRVTRKSEPQLSKANAPQGQSRLLDVAIIGLNGRYPQAQNLSELWRNLVDGVNCIEQVPANRWDWQQYYDPQRGKEGSIYTRWGGFLSDIDMFDPLFFKIPPSEAEQLDPQERLFLQSCYHAIEDAGYCPQNLSGSGKVGVFIGVTNSMYTLEPDHFSFANRVSYLFDFKGPSMAVDTACSASLTAVHLALESLYSGLSDCALAGGVNLLISPPHYIRLSQTAALSAGSQCKSFGEQADGFIDGEGVGVIVLKPLHRAERDGDHIYGVVKGSAVNAGGKTSGYSVPNPLAQADLVAQALTRSGLSAEQISYIEAHGTGTPLGDPIEIAGLTRAFKNTTKQLQFCAIGSLKSNIGHCEAAAGIAGLTKVLLQLQHRQLVPSLNAKVANPEINFAESPFKVQQTLESWDRPVRRLNGVEQTLPRMAGISSFGMGGANAHVIVQEHMPAAEPQRLADKPVIIPLSARTEAQLKQKILDLAAFVEDPAARLGQYAPPLNLLSLAWTLQSGREAMEHRLAFIASNIAELGDTLKRLAKGDEVTGVYQNQVKPNVDVIDLYYSDTQHISRLKQLLDLQELPELAQLWAKGLTLQWQQFYGTDTINRISLPNYPFAKERYWVEPYTNRQAKAGNVSVSNIHPLLQQNTSDFSRQSYCSHFDGSEFFLSDHQFNAGGDKQKILPAVAYLEMVRAAVAQATGQSSDKVLTLTNTLWQQPVLVDENKTVKLALAPGDNGQIEFEVYSDDDTLHCHGEAAFVAKPPVNVINIDKIKGQMNLTSFDAGELYQAYRSMGVEYGPSFQAIQKLHRHKTQVLAELDLTVETPLDEYVLHPGLMDSALHAAIGLIAGLEQLPKAAAVPFALDLLRICAPCSNKMYAWLRYSPEHQTSSGVVKLDVDLCDLQGNVCVSLVGLTSRAMHQQSDAGVDTLLARPLWQPLSGAVDSDPVAEHHVLLCDVPQVDVDELKAKRPGIQCYQVGATGRPSDDYHAYAKAALALARRLLRSKGRNKADGQGKLLLQLVHGSKASDLTPTGVSALLKSATLENPALATQMLLVGEDCQAEKLAVCLEQSRTRPLVALLDWRQDSAMVQSWQSLSGPINGVDGGVSDGLSAFKEHGVYLITGGLGGLGQLFCREILTTTRGARIVLTGRGRLNPQQQGDLKALCEAAAKVAAQVEYRQLDLTDGISVTELIEQLVSRHHNLNGIIHSAGMVLDNYIVNKDDDELTKVLNPKVEGTVNLDAASRSLALDWFVLFSSGASVMGNAGQSDYACGNGFLDQFAAYRNTLVADGLRQGHSLSVNWPYWLEGGMRVDDTARQILAQNTGMVPMPTDLGMQAFHRAMAVDCDQVLVMAGDLAKMQSALEQLQPSAAADKDAVSPEVADSAELVDNSRLVEQTQNYLRKLFSELFKLPSNEIDAQAAMEDYGIDSILAMKLTQKLETLFGPLSKTLFFEYQTLNALAAYLVQAHGDIITTKIIKTPLAVVKADPLVATAKAPTRLSMHRQRLSQPVQQPLAAVAIVGIAGKYPQADNLDEFWLNLKAGRDCIEEVPLSRWDHSLYFDADRKPGKSYTKWGGFINDIDKFDPLFFNISPKEAEFIDPQERLFLETAWQAIEDAGYSKSAIAKGRVGVYVGVMWGQYELLGAETLAKGQTLVPSSSYASIANRVSYFFDFHGPSMAVDTMCSSSLTAIHLASEEIRRGEIDVAIAGGVNVTVHPNKLLTMSQGSFASSDGRCRSFGAGGDGYVAGEGVGAVVLKSLSEAERQGDQIYGLIKASSVNHGGKTNGYTVPNPVAQADLILKALKKADVAPSAIGYIEAHGTGTPLGDPIEITGLGKAFNDYAGQGHKVQSCPIGSVKSNIGHLESAAGIAAMTKVLLQIKHRQLVPSLHAETLNPNIGFEQSPFYLQTQLAPWHSEPGHRRIAGISSFGAGGANAHVLVEEYQDNRVVSDAGTAQLFLLSARNSESLRAYGRKMVAFLQAGSECAFADLAYTSQVGRTAMNERLVIVADSNATLLDKLGQWLTSFEQQQVALDEIYSGNTKQSRSMAAELIAGEAGRAFLQVVIEQRDLARIAELWIAGVDIDWTALYKERLPRRVSLPSYPFNRQRYWMESPTLVPVGVPTSEVVDHSLAETTQVKQALFYRPQWQEWQEWQEWQALSTEAPAAQLSGPVLLLWDSDAAATVVNQTFAAEQVVISVIIADCYQQRADGSYTVNGADPEDFNRLVGALKSKQQLPAYILHHNSSDSLDGQLSGGIYALTWLTQALMKHKHSSLKLLSWCYGANSPAQQAIGGFAKTLMLEHPSYRAKVVALENSQLTAALLKAELSEDSWQHDEVRYSATDQRQVKTLTAFSPARTTRAQLPFKHLGVYIVTGGLGGLGLLLSEYLAQHFKARLVLLGRSELNREQQFKLDKLRAHQSDIIYLPTDVCSRDNVEAAVAEAKLRFGAINGVFHCAGVNRDSFILNKQKSQLEQVLAAKVHGTSNLDMATKDEPLDLFVLFSSMAGALGNLGQCDYAYANHFLDAFAAERSAEAQNHRRFGKTLSVNWPLWAAGGMNLSEQDIALNEQQSGMTPLPSETGLECFETLLESDLAQAIAVYGVKEKLQAYFSDAAQSADNTAPEPLDSAVDGDTLTEKTEGYLKAIIGSIIRMAPEDMDAKERFESYGIDSVMVNQFNAELEKGFPGLAKTLLYEQESIEALAAYLIDEVGNKLAARFDLTAKAAKPVEPKPKPLQAGTSRQAIQTVAVATASAVAPVADTEAQSQPIAIIGIHGVYPQSLDLDSYWENLSEGRDLTTEVPAQRWDADALYDADPQKAAEGKIYCKWGGFLPDVDKFDAPFFNVSAREARIVDPQERLFLQSTWACLEDAGYTPESLKQQCAKGRSADVGVFVGVTTNSYNLVASQADGASMPSAMPWSIANRVSYYLNLQGPSMPVDTACSSSLVALHMACESLNKNDCQMALAGGVNLYLHSSKYLSFCVKGMVSKTGKTVSFGAGDDGFVPSEAVGSVLLKPLNKAIEHRDHIYALVTSSGYEHSGRSNGYSAPNPNAQAALIVDTLSKAKINAEDIGYIEGHGTGTALGDSMEIRALSQAFGEFTEKKQYCPIGSVKANIGHGESAAGIAGIAKIILQMKHQQLLPSIHGETCNPNIDFAASPCYLQKTLTPWQRMDDKPLTALINSFGAGGVNACTVLQEYRSNQPERENQGPALVVLSAKDSARLQQMAARLMDYCQTHPQIQLGDLAYTLQLGREAMSQRLALVVDSMDGLSATLSQWLKGATDGVYQGSVDLRKRKPKSRKQPQQRQSNDLQQLAQQWVAAEPIDWQQLYDSAAVKPRRIPLPSYPFAKVRYWVGEDKASEPTTTAVVAESALHPLISHNASTLSQVGFSSLLSGSAFYAEDHKVHGEKIFPGAGYLEIACMAGNIAAEQKVSKVRDIVWSQPLGFSDGERQVKTYLKPNGSCTEVEVTSLDEQNDKVVHCEGRLYFQNGGPVAQSETMAIDELKASCNNTQMRADFYQAIKAYGFHYGNAFQSIEQFYIHDDYALSKLTLDKGLSGEFDQYLLHPSLIDGALQTVSGLVGNLEAGTAYLPFAVDEIELLKPLLPSCYVYVEAAADKAQMQGGLKKFNIKLLSGQGEILVKLNNFYVRALAG